MPSPPIPNFFLYGEHNNSSLPGFVHIEDIAARSQQHDWEIKPHRHGRLFQLLCLYEGEMQVKLDDNTHQLSGNWAVSIPPGCVHGFCFPADTQGVVLTVSAALFSPHEQQELQTWFDDLLRLPRCIHFEADSQNLVHLQQHFNTIKQEQEQMNTGYSMMLRWMVKATLMTLKRQLEHYAPPDQQAHNTGTRSFQTFRHLLEQHYRDHWGVREYAAQLHISSTTLNRLCKQQLGITAKESIQNRLLLEIKRRLIYTTATHENISHTLGFKDPSYFSRFFKNHEGISPLEYRKIKYAETETSA